MTHVPFIGAGFSEFRVLIVGESNYGVGRLTDAEYVAHWLDHPNFAKHSDCVVCRCVGGPAYSRDRLFDALTAMMLGRPGATDDDRHEKWAQIAFINFVVRQILDREEENRPTEEDWVQSAHSFSATLACMRPRAAIVLDNPSRRLIAEAGPLLEASGIKVVRLAHLTMRPAPTREERAAAWQAVADRTHP